VLAATGAVVQTYAVGTESSCTGGSSAGTLQQIADATGGSCEEIDDPSTLPDIIPDLVGSTLETLEIAVDGGAATLIPNTDITPALPQDGAATVDYVTTVNGLHPGDPEICVTANGSDSTEGTGSVTQCETIHLLQLALTPDGVTNELSADQTHQVTATILGDTGYVKDKPRNVTFEVTGQNPMTPVDVTTDASGKSDLAYSVPLEPASLGLDTIRATTTIGGESTFVEVTKEWVDTTSPVAECLEGPNPHGNTKPKAPGNGGQGQNQDGFYELAAADTVWPDGALRLFVEDSGSGTVFGPFEAGTVIKYTEANGATPKIKKIGSSNGQADAVSWHITGNGDAIVYAVDGSGNQSTTAACLVPPPPK
jgi:hypothetical protein